MERFDDPHRVRGTVEEIWIAERDVPRAAGDLRRDVGEDDARRDDAELPVVNRHDRAMAAQMFAAAARFGVPHRTCRPVGQLERGVFRERRKRRSIGDEEANPRNLWRGPFRPALAALKGPPHSALCCGAGPLRQLFLEFAAEHRVDANRSEPLPVERRVEPVRADSRRPVQRARLRDDGRGQARGRVHREMERDDVGRLDVGIAQPLLRHVDADDVPAAGAQPGRRRRESEGLAAHFVGADEKRLHSVDHLPRRCSINILTYGLLDSRAWASPARAPRIRPACT